MTIITNTRWFSLDLLSKSGEMQMHDLEKIFQQKIDNEVKIEPKDWMPDAYRKTNIR
jgi:hypothetical protein